MFCEPEARAEENVEKLPYTDRKSDLDVDHHLFRKVVCVDVNICFGGMAQSRSRVEICRNARHCGRDCTVKNSRGCGITRANCDVKSRNTNEKMLSFVSTVLRLS